MNMLSRCLLRRTGRQMAVSLVLSALIGALYGDRLHVSFALGTAGGFFLVGAWLAYQGKQLPGLRKKKQLPDFLKSPAQRAHRPSFRMDNRDFDDDLNSRTAVNEETLSEKELRRLNWLSCLISSAICFALSQFVPGI